MLGRDRNHLRMLENDFSDSVDDRHAGVERDGRRHGCADPQISFLQCRQEFAAEPRAEEEAECKEDQSDRDRGLSFAQRPAQHWRVNCAQAAHQDGFYLADALGKQKRRETRRDDERRQQRANESVSVGLRHRAENLSFDALHGE